MKDIQFELMPQSWYKRRTLTDVPPSVITFEVKDYQHIDNHQCAIHVVFDDGNQYTLDARVARNCIYRIDGSISKQNWTVHGINEHGISVLIKVLP